MARFTKIKESEAPPPLKQSGRLAARMRQYEDYVKNLSRGEVGQLTPEGNESARGIALRISRAAKRLNTPVQTWLADGNVYFKIER